MVIVSVIIILAVLLAYAEDKGLIKNGRKLSFILIVAVFSLRYGYGNDFYGYQRFCIDMAKYHSFLEAYHQLPEEDAGWLAINYFLHPLGFQFVLFVSTFALCYIYYYLINKYTLKPYRWIGVLLFLMYPNLFLLDLSMIRQGFSGALFLLAFCKGFENKWIQSIILCIIATSIHKMAVICVPFILMINLKRYFNPIYFAVGLIGVFVFLLFNPGLIESSFEMVMASEFSTEYTSYLYLGGTESIGLGLFSRIVVIIPSLIWFRTLKEFDKYVTLLFFISTFTILLSTQNVLILRLECFFLPFSVLIFPRLLGKDCVFESRPNKWNIARPLMVVGSVGWVLFSVRSFFHFFSEPTYAKAYATFHTVLSTIF